MAARSHPLLEDALSFYGEIAEEAASYSEGKTAAACAYGATCMQLPFEGKSSYYFSARLLSVAVVSLAVVYFMLQCFDLTIEGSRVAPLRRSLAAGGGGKCSIFGDEEESEEGGKYAEEDFWAGNIEGSVWESPTRGTASGPSAWQTEATRRWPSMPTVVNPAGSGGTRGFGSGREHITAAGWARSSGQLLQSEISSQRRRTLPLRPQPRGAPLPGPEGLVGDDGDERMNASPRLFQGETLEMWRGRNLPHYVAVELVSVFTRLRDAVSACQSLLPALVETHRLQLSYEVIRLVALEVGAISLVPQSLEHLRLGLGNAIASMGKDVLRHSGAGWRGGVSADMRKLIVLVDQLKNPRPMGEENNPTRYRTKMISILQTSLRVVGFCLGVLEGLLGFKHDGRLALTSRTVEQQISVVEALYKFLSAYVARDASLRFHIVECQKKSGIFLVLGREHLQLSSSRIPPLAEVLADIPLVVDRAGGLLPAPAPVKTNNDIPVAVPPRAHQHMQSPNEPLSGAPRHTQQRELIIPIVQPYLIPASTVLLQSLQEAPSSSSLPHPRFQPLPLRYHAPQHHPGQPLTSRLPHPRLNPLVSRESPQERSTRGLSLQATARSTGLEEPRLLAPPLASERGGVSAALHEYLHMRQESTQFLQPYTHLPMPVFGGVSADVGAPVHPLTRHTEQAWGGPSNSGYGIVQGGTPQNEEDEREEEVGGLLGELLKGGVQYEYVFGRKKPHDQ